jgi:hypothetical protein
MSISAALSGEPSARASVRNSSSKSVRGIPFPPWVLGVVDEVTVNEHNKLNFQASPKTAFCQEPFFSFS